MAMVSCFCSINASRSQFVKLVFPGGHVELLDRPVLAAEVMMQHPRFCVARPDVFREPAGAVAAPDTVLALGRKYYVVPKSTVQRLQKYSSRGGGVSLKRHPACCENTGHISNTCSGDHERCYKVGRKKWLTCLVGGEAKAQRPQEGVCHGGKAETAREVDVKEIKEMLELILFLVRAVCTVAQSLS